MADLESVLADVSYLMAMEKSKAAAKSAYKKFVLPDISVHCIVMTYLRDLDRLKFRSLYHEQMGRYYFSLFCGNNCKLLEFLEQINKYEHTGMVTTRQSLARKIYDAYVMPDLLANESMFSKALTDEITATLKKNSYPIMLYRKLKREVASFLEETKFKEFVKSNEFARYCQWKYIELNIPYHMSLTDFSVHRILGRGGFGEVYGCRKDDSGKMFALKCLDKKRIKLKQGEALAINERNILSRLSSPFIVNMYYCFQSSSKLFFVLDLMNGGDLHYHLSQRGKFSEEETRFYLCEIILGLEHIHNNSIVYRDLKPSNILLDEEGHVRISDLGLACDFSIREPSSAVGTHGYMAPEVIKKGITYTYTADWFSLGCVCCKLVTGHNIFRPKGTNHSKEEMDKLILEKEVILPDSMSPELQELITGLLIKDHHKRLGCCGRGSQEVKESVFFKSVDWDQAQAGKLKPPLVPPKGEVNAADTLDIGSFNDDDVKGIKLTDEDEAHYQDFNRVISAQWQKEIVDSIFEMVNSARDKEEAKEKQKFSKAHVEFYTPAMMDSDCILQGFGQKLNAALITYWQSKYLKLYPNRLEMADSAMTVGKGGTVVAFDAPLLVRETTNKGVKCVQLQRIGDRKEHQIKFESHLEHVVWFKKLRDTSQTASTTTESIGLLKANSNSTAFLVHRRDHRPLRESSSTSAVPNY